MVEGVPKPEPIKIEEPVLGQAELQAYLDAALDEAVLNTEPSREADEPVVTKVEHGPVMSAVERPQITDASFEENIEQPNSPLSLLPGANQIHPDFMEAAPQAPYEPETENIDNVPPTKDLYNLRRDYLQAKAASRGLFKRGSKKVDPEEVRKLGEQYELEQKNYIKTVVAEKLALLEIGLDKLSLSERNSKVLEFIQAEQLALAKAEIDFINNLGKLTFQKFKVKYNKISPWKKMTAGALLAGTAITAEVFGLGGVVSGGATIGRGLMSGVGTGMGVEGYIASKQEKGKVGAVAKELRKLASREDALKLIKQSINEWSLKDVQAELARIKNLQESKGTATIKESIGYTMPKEVWGVLLRKLKIPLKRVQSTADLTREAAEYLERRYRMLVSDEANASIKDVGDTEKLSQNDILERYLEHIINSQKKFNLAQESNLDKQKKNALIRTVGALVGGTAVGLGTVLSGLSKLEASELGKEAAKGVKVAVGQENITADDVVNSENLAQKAQKTVLPPPEPSLARSYNPFKWFNKDTDTGAVADATKATISEPLINEPIPEQSLPAHWTAENITVGKGGSYWSTFMKQYESNPEYFGYDKASRLSEKQFGERLILDYAKANHLVTIDNNEVVSDIRLKDPDATVKWLMKDGHLDMIQDDDIRVYSHDYNNASDTTADVKTPKITAESIPIDPATFDKETGWQDVKINRHGQEHIMHFKEIALSDLPPSFKPNADLSLEVLDADGDGAAETYNVVDDDGSSVIEISRNNAEKAIDFKDRAIDEYVISTTKANELARSVEAVQEMSSGDRLRLIDGLKLNFEDGLLSTESKNLVTEVVTKLGDDAPKYLRDQDLGLYIANHIGDIDAKRIASLYQRGIELHNSGLKHIDYNLLSKLVNNRAWNINGNILESNLKSPFSGEKMSITLSGENFNQETFNVATEQVISNNNNLARVYNSLIKNYESASLGTSRLNPGAISEILKNPAGASLLDWQSKYGGAFKDATVARLYEDINNQMGGKLAGGQLQGTVGENLEKIVLSKHIKAQALGEIKRANLTRALEEIELAKQAK